MLGKSGWTVEVAMAAYDEQGEIERKVAAAKGEAYAKPIDVGCVPSVSDSGEFFLQSALLDAFVIFRAKTKVSTGKYTDAGWAVVRLKRCMQSKFGYPNDEAFPGHPLYGKGFSGLGIFEVGNSKWEQTLVEQNRIAFPKTTSWNLRHLIFQFKENVLECLVENFELRIENRSFAELAAEVMATAVRG